MESRLGDARDTCAIAALVLVASVTDPIPCTITDISERGARLELVVEVDLPEHFIVAFPLLADQYHRRPAERRWRRGAVYGVLFVHQDLHADSDRVLG